MKVRLSLLFVAVVGVVFTVVSDAGGSENPYFVAVVAIVTLGAVVAQFIDYGPYVRHFTENDWSPGFSDDGAMMWFIDVSYWVHGRRSPVATVWLPLPDGGFE